MEHMCVTYRYVGLMKIPNLHPGNVHLAEEAIQRCKNYAIEKKLLGRNKLHLINDLGVV